MNDVIIVGAGPAGLSAALILGRCRRRVVVFDWGPKRNAASHAMHGFISRDGTDPAEFLRLAREQLRPYDTVRIVEAEVIDACPGEGGFEVIVADGSPHRARTLLLATGVEDRIPEIEGIGRFYGASVHHCPYCDGWEHRDEPIAVYGRGKRGSGLALELTAWSRDLVLCTDGPARLAAADRARLARNGIALRESRIARLEGEGDQLERICFADDGVLERRALFFNTGQVQRSTLPQRLGCEFTSKGFVRCGRYESTNIPSLFVAGDASHSVQLVIVAADEGARAAFAINTALLKADLL